VAAFIYRSKRSKSGDEIDSASDDGVIYDTSQVEIISPQQAAMARQAPPQSSGIAVAQAQQLQPIAPPSGIQQQPYQYQQQQVPVQVQQPQTQPQPVPQEGPVVQLPDQPQAQPQQQQQQIKKY
jgi:hypothetical protein